MTERILTFDTLFDDHRRESERERVAAETPGTPEHAREEAFSDAYARRVAERVQAAVAAGGVIGVTHTDQGEPLDLSPESEEDDDEDESADEA